MKVIMENLCLMQLMEKSVKNNKIKNKLLEPVNQSLIKSELWKNRKPDGKIFEIAAQKHFNILGIKHGGYLNNAFNLILGMDLNPLPLQNVPDKGKLLEIINNPNNVVTAGTKPWLNINEQKEYSKDIFEHHAYAVTKMYNKYVYLINPHNTEREIKIPIADFIDIMSHFSVASI